MSEPTSESLVFSVPLRGVRAVEASAGTGKTWTITGLYLRLLLETGLAPDRILVVTYTLAATDELRSRIRALLLRAREAFEEGETQDDLCRALLDRHPDRAQASRRIENALRTFDEAAVFTIHGFCQRVLGESAFECGAPLRSELLADQSELLAECVEDFWRRETYEGDPLWTSYLLDTKVSPGWLRGEIQGLVGKPFARVLEPDPPQDVADLAHEYAEAFAAVRALWPGSREAVAAILSDTTALSGQSYRPAWAVSRCAALEAVLSGPTPRIELPKGLAKVRTSELRRGTRANKKTPEHPFFDAFERLWDLRKPLADAFAARRTALLARLLEFCNEEIRRRKAERRVRWFDDLLIDLESALAAPSSGPALARAIRERYGAALIDEFQDTDPLQYSIFQHVYGAHEAPVFLVGDPKQAIYGFRGADVFAYLAARDDADETHTLDRNWRSDPGVVRGTNAIFGAHEKPFVLDGIPFHPAIPARSEPADGFLGSTGLTPLRVWFLPRPEGVERIGKSEADARITDATADEIARLLASGAELDGRRVHGGDVAVLVRMHDQGQLIRRALARRGIPAVQLSQVSVFQAAEAEELERILAAIAEPGRERLVRGALATSLLGVDAQALVRLAESETEWDAKIDVFRQYREIWLEHGIGSMFRRLLLEQDIPSRLLAEPDGERRLTNLLQIGELLSGEAARDHRGTEKLIQWIATRRRAAASGGTPPEEHLPRLESDEQLVQINTVHGAKGLQYPIVFVPFAWTASARDRNRPFVKAHDEGAGGRPSLDFGSPRQDELRRLAEREDLAEGLRLLYVALTRARHHCTFAWGAVNGAESSAPAWLFHRASAVGTSGEVPLSVPFHARADGELLRDLEAVARDSEGALRVDVLGPRTEPVRRIVLPEEKDRAPLAARIAERRIETAWSITSFSALRGGRAIDRVDHDAGEDLVAAPPAAPSHDIFGFPRGARAGVCLHRLFEQLDFASAEAASVRALAEETLALHGLPATWTPVVERLVVDVLATPLLEGESLRLGGVGRGRRLTEVEFHYPAGHLTLESLNEILARNRFPIVPDRGPGEELPRPLVDGYVKGYIDLVFEAGGRYYLADWKSNWLGATVEAYATPRLRDAVHRELYTLQYVMYALALHRHLRLRLPDYDYERHFGGAFCLFLRGMKPETAGATGVFHDRPTRALIDELDERIGGERSS
ncbi:MAG: exodeoxyribonuclease V subunit beta [Deltaproteobacteria bacterium]|nr:exodeoxyribonuclease V subunit beta [Deltaproteobacteria bacterium]